MTCGDTVIKYSKDVEVTDSSTFGLQVYGKEGVQFEITVSRIKTRCIKESKLKQNKKINSMSLSTNSINIYMISK